MSIAEKLEHIRKQPEHIRVRYVFLCVGVSMVFVLVLWLVSLGQNLKNIRDNASVQSVIQSPPLEGAVRELQKQRDTLNEGMQKEPETPSQVESGGEGLPKSPAEESNLPKSVPSSVESVRNTGMPVPEPEKMTDPKVGAVSPTLPKSVQENSEAKKITP